MPSLPTTTTTATTTATTSTTASSHPASALSPSYTLNTQPSSLTLSSLSPPPRRRSSSTSPLKKKIQRNESPGRSFSLSRFTSKWGNKKHTWNLKEVDNNNHNHNVSLRHHSSSPILETPSNTVKETRPPPPDVTGWDTKDTSSVSCTSSSTLTSSSPPTQRPLSPCSIHPTETVNSTHPSSSSLDLLKQPSPPRPGSDPLPLSSTTSHHELLLRKDPSLPKKTLLHPVSTTQTTPSSSSFLQPRRKSSRTTPLPTSVTSSSSSSTTSSRRPSSSSSSSFLKSSSLPREEQSYEVYFPDLDVDQAYPMVFTCALQKEAGGGGGAGGHVERRERDGWVDLGTLKTSAWVSFHDPEDGTEEGRNVGKKRKKRRTSWMETKVEKGVGDMDLGLGLAVDQGLDKRPPSNSPPPPSSLDWVPQDGHGNHG
ncbi:hypothetical protein HMI54_005036, partial [Coelomomyces lativittatus]